MHYAYILAYLLSHFLDYVEANFSFNFNFHNELMWILLRKLSNISAVVLYSKIDLFHP